MSSTQIFRFWSCCACLFFGVNGYQQGFSAPAAEAPLHIPETRAVYSLSASNLMVCGTSLTLDAPNGFAALPDDGEAAWVLRDFTPDNYFLGVYLSVGGNIGDYGPANHVLYHNGRQIEFSEMGGMSRIGTSYVAEFISECAILLRDGDELRISPRMAGRLAGPLNLYLQRPAHGVLSVARGIVNDPFGHDYFRCSVTLVQPGTFERRAQGALSVQNPLSASTTLDIDLKVLDYFMTPVFELKKTLTVEARATHEEAFEYPWGTSDRYMAVLEVNNADGRRKQTRRQIFVPSRTELRSKLWLNREWDFKPVTNACHVVLSQSGDGKWQAVDLPFRVKGRSVPGRRQRQYHNANVFWYRKRFALPEWMRQHPRYLLTFTQVGFDAHIWVNGHEVHYNYAPHSPCRLDITGYLDRDSENEILVGVRDEVASLNSKELIKGRSVPVRRYSPVIAPHGDCGLQEVFVEGHPKTRLQDTKIVTSFRRKDVRVTHNLSALEAGEYTLISAIFSRGKKVCDLDASEMSVDRSTAATNVTVTGTWAAPVLWSPWNPNLLRLTTELKTVDGRTIDRVHTRFGFREVWSEGMALFINGIRTKIAAIQMADFSSRENYRNYIARGKRLQLTGKIHMMTGPMLQDINDEEGLLTFLDITGICSPTGQRYECDAYWENAGD